MADRPDFSTSTLADLASRAPREPAAFEALHRRLTPGLLRFFRARAGERPELLDELAQRAWTGVWDSLAAGRYDPTRSAFTTYTYAVATNVWLQHLRAAGLAPTGLDADAELAFRADHGPDGAAAGAETLDALRRAIAAPPDGDPSLTETDRWILRLSAQGHPDRAIASRLGIAASTLNERKKHALGALKRVLEAKGFRADSAERDRRGAE